jgi:hypothetical protein
LQVYGITISKKQPTAIINNEVYKVGDVIGDKKIKEILPKKVILSDGKESVVLTLEK